MPVSFNNIPSSIRVPGAYAEVDSSGATSTGTGAHHVLLIGYRSSDGAATAGQIRSIVGERDGEALFGARSQLAAMARAFRRLNQTARVSAVAVDEAGGGTAATGTITVAGTATRDGTLTARFGDVRVSVPVASGTTAAAAAGALATAADAATGNAFAVAAAGAVVTATARHKGTAYNGTTLAVEAAPAGLTSTIGAVAGGATDASLTGLVAALDEERYDTIVTGLADAAAMTALEAEIARRSGPTVKMPGHVIGALAGTHSALTTYGAARNSQHSTVMGTGTSPTPPWVWAAQVAARDVQRCESLNPNRPRKGLTLPDVEAPPRGERFDFTERNLLLADGISTFNVDSAGVVSIERLVTTYQKNTAGNDDTAYLAIETVRNLNGILLEWLALAGKYESALLGPDGDTYAPGVPVLTPKGWKGEVAAAYDDLVLRGRCKDAAGFRASMIAEINGGDSGRLDFSAEPRLVQGLNSFAMRIAFRL